MGAVFLGANPHFHTSFPHQALIPQSTIFTVCGKNRPMHELRNILYISMITHLLVDSNQKKSNKQVNLFSTTSLSQR